MELEMQKGDGQSPIESVCVYCGSRPVNDSCLNDAAWLLGKIFAENSVRLVYGGGSTGFMGIIATSVCDHGGKVTGITPRFLIEVQPELQRPHELVVTDNMHQRKQAFFERSDAFVALPGGIGTLEELVEMLTWAQLGRHTKPVLIVNINGFWDPFIDLLDHMRRHGLINETMPVNLVIADAVEDVLWKLRRANGERSVKNGNDRVAAGEIRAHF